jgi:hypothetical protein
MAESENKLPQRLPEQRAIEVPESSWQWAQKHGQIMAHAGHIRASESIIKTALWITGLFAAAAIGAGVVAIVWNAVSPTQFNFVGLDLTTGHAGVALIGLGAATLVLVVRRIMRALERLGAL